MSTLRYQALGPLLSGEGSRAFIGLELTPDGRAIPVVLVWVPEEANRDAALLARIRKETEHAAKLEHPHIVRVHGFASLDEGHARVVEFADGESLRKVLETAKKLPVPMAARLIVDAASGAHYAHVAGNDDGVPLVHGDLRPETLLMSFSGITKVSGYGALLFAPREMGGQRVRGRRIHTAPEQIIGGREAVTVATDVYLLGLTLLECLTGNVPFLGEEDFDQAVLTKPLPLLEDGAIPEALAEVIRQACSKRAPDRQANPLALKEAIERAVPNIATHQELAGYLKALFPDSDAARAARRQAIDAGIADFVRRQWAERPAASAPVAAAEPARAAAAVPKPVAPAGVPAGAPVPIAAVAVAPKPKAAPSTFTIEPDAPDPAAKSRAGWFLLAGTLVLLAGLWWFVSATPARPIPADVPKGPAGQRPSAPPAIADAGAVAVAVPDASVDSAAAGVDAGQAPIASPPPVDAGAALATEATLELDVNPDVEVLADGQSLGKTPLKRTFKPGRHTFQLVNKQLGISLTRSYTLEAGKTTQDEVRLGKGVVVISAPEGAAIFIDGIRRGTAPVKELTVYEGRHSLLVTVNGAKWTESFTMYEDQRVSFNVEMQ